MKLAAFALLALPLLTLAQDELPAGKGKETVERMCSACHGVEYVTGQRLTRSGWESMVDQMMGRGATGTDAEVAEVITYLSEHFAKQVNINKASVNDLQVSLGFTKAEAEAIIKARTAKPIADLAALKAVPGLDAKKLDDLKPSLSF
jgi:DNA uptake protein ComE-like DNA-binding protein